MATDEIKQLRYCYSVLRARVADAHDGLAYWQMNLKIATYFLKRYDTEFVPGECPYDAALLDRDDINAFKNHPLLQQPNAGARSYPKLDETQELNLKRRIAVYFASRKS
jgi:hypothetical protein